MDEDEEWVTITISRSTLDAAVNCVESRANDEAEPERYRRWYQEALAELESHAVQRPPRGWYVS
jgi:hypothetical protein